MHAPLNRHRPESNTHGDRHPATSRRRTGLRALLATGLALGLGSAMVTSLGASPASAQSAQDLIEKAQEKERLKKLLKPYTRDVRAAIRDEYRRLGKGPGAIELAINNVVTNGGGGSNSAVKRDAFAQTVFPIVRENCKDCHAGSGPGFPGIAHKSVTTAYDAIVSNQKVRLSDPERSRLVQRLASDRHYCWSDCSDDADAMERAVEDWAAMEDSLGSGVNVNLISSTSSSMTEGVVDKQKERFVDHVIAKWEFREGEGDRAKDSSKVEPKMHLELNNTEWMSNWGLQFERTSWAIAEEGSAKKLYRRIASLSSGSQQYSVEAWVAPANVDQDGPARIASYSDGTEKRNFTVAQNLYNYVFRNRNMRKRTDKNGTPELMTADDDQDAQAALQHVVWTYDRFNGRRIYVNGRYTGDKDPVNADFLHNWNKDFAFVVGNETSRNRQWEGQLRYLAIHDVALSRKQIKQNFNQGVGQRFLVTFSLDDWLATSGNAVQFTVREFDGYSYLFCDPSFTGPPPLDYRVAGMTISVNGNPAATGQAFSNVETIVTTDGASVSRLCSIIPKDQGPDADRFSIYFERLGDFQNVVVEDPPVLPEPEDDTEQRPIIGIRTFDQINLSMASLTGVSPLQSDVNDTYNVIRQQLPATADPRSFLASHQTAVAKLALEYCNAMVDDTGLRDTFFGTTPRFEFDQPVPTAFSNDTKRDQIVDTLYDKMIGTGMVGTDFLEQPMRSEVAPIMNDLIADLTAGCDAATCPAVRTQTVVKASCAAVLASASVAIY